MKKFVTIHVGTAIYMRLKAEKLKRNLTWDELINQLLKENYHKLEPKMRFDVKVSQELYEKLNRIRKKYGLTWDEFFISILP